ncbi:MAG: HEAT repeat domain-containing protein, partial [Planctomycetaceae bacterium]|nr:HEAT repeat domain-containing protein [Planctomycetaceae bacterium]
VTFDDWGQHVASHPIYAAAFHALDPPYPDQHPKPTGLTAYSGTCGHEFVDFATMPVELQGHMIKVRYKPTNRVEILKWKEGPFGFDEEYVSDLLFSTNLSFIPVDLKFGPRGALYVCDWYNPIKGHAQYSLRDERRDRHSGRIWRITAKGLPLLEPPKLAGATIPELLELLKRPESFVRAWARRELREHSADDVAASVHAWLPQLEVDDPRLRHHQVEAMWVLQGIDRADVGLVEELLQCEQHLARAAAVEQLRYVHEQMPGVYRRLSQAANDENGIVRMQAAIACSYVGTPEALDVLLQTLNHPADGHLAYAIQCALGSHTLRKHWEHNDRLSIRAILHKLERSGELKEPSPTAEEAMFDQQPDVATVRISCLPERMLFTVRQFAVRPGQPVRLVFTNPDANDHNLVIVQPGAMEEVGMAANAMARDPQNANSDFIPAEKESLILQATPMIGPNRKTQVHVLRFRAPERPGLYPFVCTFPGHWVVMNGVMVVAGDPGEAEAMLAAAQPKMVRAWQLSDFPEAPVTREEETLMRGMQAFVKARCHQCHVLAGHGVNLGPDLTQVRSRFQGRRLLQQMLDPSAEIHPKYQNYQFVLKSGAVVTGIVIQETPGELKVVPNLLSPDRFERVPREQVEEQVVSRISSMPEGLLNVLTEQEILDLLSFVENSDRLPGHLRHHGPQSTHQHK